MLIVFNIIHTKTQSGHDAVSTTEKYKAIWQQIESGIIELIMPAYEPRPQARKKNKEESR
jgi:hypothetical protein